MPLLSLPTEILEEIASRLRTKFYDDFATSVEAGSSTALVCRRLYSIGQALRWHHLVLQPSLAPALASHFASHPHLAALVRHLFRKEVDDSMMMVTMTSLDRRGLIAVLAKTRALRNFGIESKTGEGLEEIIEAAEHLPFLHRLHIFVREDFLWTSRLTSTFTKGYCSSIDFTLSSSSLSLPGTGIVDNIPSLRLRQLATLELGWGSPIPGRPVLLDSVSKFFDLSSLRQLIIHNSRLARSQLFEQIPGLPSLSKLQIAFAPTRISYQLPELIPHLPDMKSLEILELNGLDDTVLHSPVPLSALLDSLPASIKFAVFDTLRFAGDFHSFPKRSLPLNRSDGAVICGVWARGTKDTLRLGFIDKSASRVFYRFLNLDEKHEMKMRFPTYFR